MMLTAVKNWWGRFQERRPELSKFLMFLVLSNGVTVLQLALMPLFRWGFASFTDLTDVSFRVLPVGSNIDGSAYYMFDYAAGPLPGGGGGLAYFLAVQITLLIAQVINFFLQRNITFKSNTPIWRAAFWYAVAYVVITFIAAAAQGFYKAPIYGFFMETLDWGSTGSVVADVLTMIINSAISFWVFYPIFKVIFRQVPAAVEVVEHAGQSGER
jgi:putative flippase GtrA